MEEKSFLDKSGKLFNHKSETQFVRKLLAIVVVIVLLALSGCSTNEKPESQAQVTPTPTPKPAEKIPAPSESEVSELRIYYYYHPKCPNCQAVEPLIEFLMKNSSLDFDVCNVQFFSNCTNESKALAFAVKEKTGFFGTPTAVVEVGKNYTVFVGKYQIMDMVRFVGNFSDLPDVRLNETSYSVEECLSCHEERGLDPPSTYTCSYCCHGI